MNISGETKSLLLWCSPVCLMVGLLIIYPLADTVLLSFTDATLMGGIENWIGGENYVRLLRSNYFLNAVANSIVFTGASVILHITFGLVIGVLLAQKIRGIRFFRAFILTPYMVPTVASVFLFKWLFDVNHGTYNLLLTELGIWRNPIPVFGTANTAMAAVVLLAFWQFVPFTAIMVLSRVLAIPQTYYEMAQVDGLSSLQTFRYVTLPQLKSVVKMIAVLRAIWMLGMFDIIILSTGGGPLRSTETLPVFAYRLGFYEYNLGLGSAVYTIMLIIMFTGVIIYWKVVGRS